MRQGSAEWLAARVGKITGSRFGAVMALGAKGQPLEARKKLVETLALERLIGVAEEVDVNQAMQHGTDTEPLAREWFEFVTGYSIIQHGLVDDSEDDFIAVSPDGQLGTLAGPIDEGIEIKCPFSRRIHLNRLHNATAARLAAGEWEPEHDHYWQMQGQMMVMNWTGIYYVTFQPSMPAGLQGHYIVIERNGDDTNKLREQCRIVHAEANIIVQSIKSKLPC